MDFLKILYNVEILKKNYIEILKQNAATIAVWEDIPHLYLGVRDFFVKAYNIVSHNIKYC